MRTMSLVVIVLGSTWNAWASASNAYVTAGGGAVGGCPAGSTTFTPAQFNSSGNWGSGANQIGPGTTVLICGTITFAAGATGLQPKGGGVSGNPITLKFDTGAILQAPYFYGNVNGGCTGTTCGGAINLVDYSYITVDGANSGIIQNTANGSSLANQNGSVGVYIGQNTATADHIMIKNLKIQNLYVNTASEPQSTPGQNTADIQPQANVTNIEICNCTLSNSHAALDGQLSGSTIANGPSDCSRTQAANGINIHGNTMTNHGWGMHVGGNGTVNIYDNTITDWSSWLSPTGANAYHLDGIIANGFVNQTQTLYIYRNYFHGDFVITGGSPTGFIYCTYGGVGDGSGTSCYAFNNLFVGTGNTQDNGSAVQFTATGTNPVGPYYYYNNTFVNFGYHFYLFGGTPGMLTSENNIFQGGPAGNTFFIAQNQDINVNTIVAHTNLYYQGGDGWNLGIPSARYFTLATWQAGSGTDGGSVSGNPNLSTTSYMPLASSPAIASGTNLTSLCGSIPALCTDKAGVARPASGKWDIGAYQFLGISPPTGLSLSVQ